MSSRSKTPSIPLDRPVTWEEWLRGRRARRETSQQVAPGMTRRDTGPSDRRLRQFFHGRRGLPFRPTEEL
jgi:hypothetical protein